ncbi:MAG: iron ABC transporter permease [Bacteroidetes bacterium]|nr:iron ABC transporter permease [Bacteroidota bacterium]
MNKHYKVILFIFLLALFAFSIFNLVFAGSKPLQLFDFKSENFVFYQIRLPKLIIAIIAGAALSVSGLFLQIIFRNPLAGPYVLGISSGASLGVAFTMLITNFTIAPQYFFISESITVISSISGALVVTFFILTFAKKINSNVVLLLAGLIIGQLCSAIQGVFEFYASAANLKTFSTWGMGSLSNTTITDLKIILPVFFMLVILSLLMIKPLNAFLLGESYAEGLGINYKKVRFYLIVISSAFTGLITAYCGPIAFVGISVPILARLILKTSRIQFQLFACLILGAVVLVVADTLCYNISGTGNLPINAITTCMGAPLVLFLLLKQKQW